ncbi:MAG: hypothetical protein ABIT16_10800 [Croceibacterium sp.]
MRRLRHFLPALATVAVLLAASTPSVVSAQDLDQESTRREIGQKYGECVAAGRLMKPHAINFVLTGSLREAQELSHGNCLLRAVAGHTQGGGGGSTITGAWAPGIFRKIMADGLVRNYFKTSGPTDFSAVAPLDPDFSMTELFSSDLPREAQLALAVDYIAECATRREPEAVRQLAQTDINSTEELAALRGLAPAFGACLPPDIAVNYPRYLLRDSAVLAYARLVYSLATAGTAQEAAQ